jgi:two-component system chemotaxis response regulator CheY
LAQRGAPGANGKDGKEMTIRILAIDDSPTMRGLVAAALEPNGFELHLAEDGMKGLDILSKADPHLVITDINMPRLDGFGVIEGVRSSAAYASVPILVLTTESGNDLKDRARRAGATGWIVKPFDDSRLIQTINRVLGL